MRKEVITVRCDGDGCKSYADVERLSDAPPNWYVVAHSGDNGRASPHERFDLCSLACVNRWAKARAKVRGEIIKEKQTNAKTRQCAFCGVWHAPQGMHLHEKYCPENPNRSAEPAISAA